MGAMTLIATLSSLAWPTHWRWPALLLGGPFVLLVGVSRIVRGVAGTGDLRGSVCGRA
jgi:undecaprenyl-diphosphatase